MVWLQFFISAALIVFAGTKLTVYADIISDRFQWGKVWVGIILLGLVTSLPEMMTTLTAVIQLKANDLAIGNVLGSNNFNPLLIVFMDMFYRKGSVTNAITPTPSHRISAILAIGLTFIVLGEVTFASLGPLIGVFDVSFGSWLIAAIYFFGIKKLAVLGTVKSDPDKTAGGVGVKEVNVKRILGNLLLSIVLVVVSAIYLAKAGDVIAEKTGLGETFVGSIFLAIVTSFPELIVTISAVKIGAFDLAIGNIFGSNSANIFIIFLCSLFFGPGYVLESVAKTHVLTAGLSILLVSIALVGIHHRNKRTLFGLGWDSILMLLVFLSGVGLLYQLR